MPLTGHIIGNTINFPNASVINCAIIDAIIDGKYESIEKIHIPASLNEIPFGIFYGLPNLSKIDVNPDNTTFSSIDGVLFDKKGEKLLCYPCEKKDTKYKLPHTVNEIISWWLEGLDYDDKCVSRTGFGFRNNKYLQEIILNTNLAGLKEKDIKYALEGCSAKLI